MRYNFKILTLIALITLIVSQVSYAGQISKQVDGCYSAYQAKQKLKLLMVFGKSTQRQNIKFNFDIHVRKIKPSPSFLASLNKQRKFLKKNVNTFVFYIRPKQNSVNDINKQVVKKYEHPFLVNFDQMTGAIITLESTANDPMILKEFLGYADLFQYTKNKGSYAYRNGNGNYNAELNYAGNSAKNLSKVNKGYTDDGMKIKVNQSLLSINIATGNSNECFYYSAHAEEVITTSMGINAYVKANTNLDVLASEQRKLPLEHFFHSLTSDLTQWPTFIAPNIVTQQQAFKRLPSLFTKLQLLVDDKKAFDAAMKNKKELWPFLAMFMVANDTDSNLINRVAWSLNNINNTGSVSALVKMTISDLPNENIYRSIVTLITSSAEVDQESIDELTTYLTERQFSDSSSQESLLLLRTLGALANQRSQHSPKQSDEIKQYLYTHVDGASDQFRASIYDSIGAMGSSVDRQGIDVLVQGLNEESVKVKNAAINALGKLPYQPSNSDLYIAELESNQHSSTQVKIIELLGRTSKDDTQVKNTLLELVGESSGIEQQKQSIASLKMVDFDFSNDEIKILEKKLKNESDKSSQKKLASLILKHRRKLKKAANN